MIKLSDEVAKIQETANNIAIETEAEIMGISFWEIAFLKENIKVFDSFLSKEELKELTEQIEKRINEIPRIPKATVELYKKTGRPLPIRKDKSVLLMLRIAEEMATDKWITGEISQSHILISLLETNRYDASFYMFFRTRHQLGNNILEYFFKKEAEELGLEYKSPEEQENPYVTDLIKKAEGYKKPFVGREDVIDKTIQTLCRMEKCNPVYVGEPGVGKTAIVYGLAKRIKDGAVPGKLKDAELYSVDVAAMLAGSQFRGEFEARIKELLKTMEQKKNVILFFDEIHTIIGAGTGGNTSMDAANIIKPSLVEGKIRFIGATTYDEYGKYIEKDKALARRFQKIEIEEPSLEDATEILMGVKDAYEQYHGVKYTDAAVKAAVNLSSKYILDRFLPDKAIDILDEAGSYCSIYNKEHKGKVTDKDIEDVMVKICKINQIEEDKNSLKVLGNLSKRINAKVFGQSEAAEALSKAIQKAKVGLGNAEKPIGSFLFVGPSGVGKTEMAKQLAEILKMHLIRIDMSEYSEANAVSKVFGTSAGYIGYDEGGILTNAVLKNPNSVLLLDEIEKAHPDIFKTLLQVMDYGMMTDNKGRKISFRNCIIIMTSNAGATVAVKRPIGISAIEETRNVDGIMNAVNEMFAPEFRGRLTKIIVFNGITKDICKMIVRKELKLVDEKLKAKRVYPEYTEECIEELIRLGVSSAYGAREVQKVIDEHITSLFVEKLISGKISGKCIVNFKKGKFNIQTTSMKEKLLDAMNLNEMKR